VIDAVDRAAPARVSASEHDLLTLARALCGAGSFALVEPLLGAGRKLSPRVSPAALRVLGETLTRGLVLELGRRGGARAARFLDAHGEVRAGRLWERHATPPTLTLTSHTPRLLRAWISGRKPDPSTPAPAPRPAYATFTLADTLVGYLALDAATTHALSAPASRFLAGDLALRAQPLVWLGFTELLAGAGPPALDDAAWDALFADRDATLVLEALQPDLARLVAAGERRKRHIRSGARMRGLGEAQDAVLAGFLAAADRAGRRDLAGFVVTAGVELCASAPQPSAWLASLEGVGSLGERAAARHAAGAFLRAFARWAVWDEQHRAVRFVDDGYPAAQHLLACYQPARAGAADHAERVRRALDSLDSAAELAARSPTDP
jgi:hypothetical protein